MLDLLEIEDSEDFFALGFLVLDFGQDSDVVETLCVLGLEVFYV